MAALQRKDVRDYLSGQFPGEQGGQGSQAALAVAGRLCLFKGLEGQHDFKKYGLNAGKFNATGANAFKSEEAKAVTIGKNESMNSRTGDDSNTVQTFFNVNSNALIYCPGPPQGGALWGRVAHNHVPGGVTFNGSHPEPSLFPSNTSNHNQTYSNNPWKHRCYFKFLNASNQEKHWRITAVYSKNNGPIYDLRQKFPTRPTKEQKASFAWRDYKNVKRSMENASHQHVLKGVNLLRALEIPDHSICVRDMEGAAGSFFRAVRGRNADDNAPDRPGMLLGGTPRQFVAADDFMRMYSYADPVTDADPNGKIYCDNFGIYNVDSQVIISAVVNKQTIIVKGQNANLRMNFNISHKSTRIRPTSWHDANTRAAWQKGTNGLTSLRLGKIEQNWNQPTSMTLPGGSIGLTPSTFQIPSAFEDNRINSIVKKWEEVYHSTGTPSETRASIEALFKLKPDHNAIKELSEFLTTRHVGVDKKWTKKDLLKKALNHTGWHLFSEILDDRGVSKLSATSLQSAAYGLQRKAGGDRFQGWQVRNLMRGNITSPVNEYCWNWDPTGATAPIQMPVQEAETENQVYGSHANLQTILSRGRGDAFVITGDIPFLCWCLRNDVNVLFGSLGEYGTENPKFIYFRVQD